MTDALLFVLNENEHLPWTFDGADGLSEGEFEIRRFPDEETYVRVHSDVDGVRAVILCTLDRPDTRFLPLYFLARTLSELGAQSIVLVAPYLSYMRQDRRFQSGEGITSRYFADLLSGFLDGLVTVDPHLHRHHSLSDIYHLETAVMHAAPAISRWIPKHVEDPVLVGPDEESEQWVSEVSERAGVPHMVLHKERRGDRDVEVSGGDVESYRHHTPVLLDDIISTGQTLIETVHQLKEAGFSDPVCMGIHPVFADGAFEELTQATSKPVVTCNTIPHPTNQIDVSPRLCEAIVDLHSRSTMPIDR